MAESGFFPNEFNKEQDPSSPETATANHLLSLPYSSFSDRLKITALHLKETVPLEQLSWFLKLTKLLTIRMILSCVKIFLKLVILLLLETGYYYIFRHVTFICGQAGVSALGAVVAKQSNDDNLCDHYLKRFREIKLPKDLPNELLYGRAGYLWACLFLNKNLGEKTISSALMRTVTVEIVKAGRKMSTRECPLMYEWHGKRYWGGAHGLAGIMNVLMDLALTEEELEDVKGTLFYMIKNRFPSGNYPSSEGRESDRLVHWCHGAPGVALTLAKAAKVFGDDEFHKAAVDAGEVVWERGLLKRVGICHGISGNAYVFLSLYRLTSDVKFLYRAKAFASFLHENALMLISEGTMHGGDRPFSLFEGIGGMAYLFLDMIDPSEARFPAYEI